MLARAEGHAPEALYTTGLFSVLDALLDIPMEQVLETLPLSDDVSAALRGLPGRATDILSIVRAHEVGKLDDPRLLALEPGVLLEAWIEALEWTHEADMLMRAKRCTLQMPHFHMGCKDLTVRLDR